MRDERESFCARFSLHVAYFFFGARAPQCVSIFAHDKAITRLARLAQVYIVKDRTGARTCVRFFLLSSPTYSAAAACFFVRGSKLRLIVPCGIGAFFHRCGLVRGLSRLKSLSRAGVCAARLLTRGADCRNSMNRNGYNVPRGFFSRPARRFSVCLTWCF